MKEKLEIQTTGLNPSAYPLIKVSIFKNYYSATPYRTVDLLRWLTTERYKEEVTLYRKTRRRSKQRKIKSNLPCVTPSGIFKYRNKNGLIQHSGYLCIDIDECDNSNILDNYTRSEIKKILGRTFDSLLYAGLSISGKGFCLIFRIAYPEQHEEQYKALALEIKEKTGLIADKNCSDICRLRGASYDAYPYCNPQAKAYRGVFRRSRQRSRIQRPVRKKQLLDEKVYKLVNIINQNKLDITDDYKEWYKIGCALANEYGEKEGLRLFQQVSSYSPKYDPLECSKQFAGCMHSTEIRIETFLWICKQHGVTFK